MWYLCWLCSIRIESHNMGKMLVFPETEDTTFAKKILRLLISVTFNARKIN